MATGSWGSVLLVLVTATGCGRGAPQGPAGRLDATWAPPPDSAIPDDSLGAAIRRGLALLVDTRDSLPGYALSSLNCTSCHLDGGRQPMAAPLVGVQARFPRYISRAGAVIPLEDRINYCMTRSLAGNRLPNDSREMQDMVAYLSFLSRGLPIGEVPAEIGIPAIPEQQPDSARGHQVYQQACATCHGVDGEGGGGGYLRAPALWGPASFSIGASMARVERAAAFIRHNMPLTAPGSLTDQQAWDVAAYINWHPRPDMPGKELDWPAGDARADVPYRTRGHEPSEVREVLPRRQPERALVPAPRSVGRSEGDR